MSVTTGYTLLPSGNYVKNTDGSGPYVFDGTTFTLAGTGSGGGGGGGGASTIADGADVAQGAVADAAVAAGAAGTLSAKLRRLTTDMGTVKAAVGAQATAAALSVTVATDDALLGTAADAAVTAGATGTVSAKLRALSRDVGTVAGAVSSAHVATTATGRRVRTQVTRPANQTPYGAGDAVGAAAAAITFAAIGPASGHILLTSIDLMHEVTAVPSGMTSFRLHLYNATPPSALADNALWDLASGDVTSYIGYVDFGVLADVGSNLFVQVDNVLKHVQCDASGNLYGYLVTNGGWTPGANSTVFDVTLRSIEC